MSTWAALNTVNARAHALRRRGVCSSASAASSVSVGVVGDLPEDAEGAALAFADLGAEGLPLLVGGPAGGRVGVVEGSQVEGEDVAAGVAVAGGGVGRPAGRAEGAPRHLPVGGAGFDGVDQAADDAVHHVGGVHPHTTSRWRRCAARATSRRRASRSLSELVGDGDVDAGEEVGGVDLAVVVGLDAEAEQNEPAAVVVHVEGRARSRRRVRRPRSCCALRCRT